MKRDNSGFQAAKNNRNDEFYTHLVDVEKELSNYGEHLKGKLVFLNCDNPKHSNFWKFFETNFKTLGLSGLVAVHLNREGNSYQLETTDGKTVKTELEGNGDFRNPESVEILKRCDIVITNPPFSLFREYIDQLLSYNKKFLVLGNLNSITYKQVFRQIKYDKVWTGVNSVRSFTAPDGSLKASPCLWVTNLENHKGDKKLELSKEYDPEEYPTYDNYDAIEVSRVKNIPLDYAEKMGVPITFLLKYNPDQFEIIGLAKDNREVGDVFVQGDPRHTDATHKGYVGMVLKEEGKLRSTYARVIIKKIGESDG
jgi:hypothetical protein